LISGEGVRRSDEPSAAVPRLRRISNYFSLWLFDGRFHRSKPDDPIVAYLHPNIKFWFHQGGAMIERNITLPEMILWTGTRVALGAGIGMLISRGLSKDAMKAAGLALTVVGGFTTIPLAISIMGKKDLTRPEIRSVA
jgi:hypothetical protein